MISLASAGVPPNDLTNGLQFYHNCESQEDILFGEHNLSSGTGTGTELNNTVNTLIGGSCKISQSTGSDRGWTVSSTTGNPFQMANGQGNATINIWALSGTCTINGIPVEDAQPFVSKYESSPQDGWVLALDGWNDRWGMGVDAGRVRSTIDQDAGGWEMFTIRYYDDFVLDSGSDMNLSVNNHSEYEFFSDADGTLTENIFLGSKGSVFTSGIIVANCSNFWMDEFAFWNRTLTDEEVNILWNNGAGLTLDNLTFSTGGLNPRVTLNTPIDNEAVADEEVNFTADLLVSDNSFNLTNATWFIWNSDSTIINQSNITISDMEASISELFGPFDIGVYEWNVYGCVTNGTSSNCEFSMSNFTFSSAFSIVSQNYNNNTYETDNETFIINITTLPDILAINSYLIYDGQNYFADSECSDDGNCTITRTIDIPLVNGGEEELKNFSWNISVFDGITGLTSGTPEQQQNVSRIHLEECGTYTVQTLNYTAYDERTLARLNPYIFEGTFFYWLGGGSVKQNSSVDETSGAEVDICINPPDRDFFLDTDITYSKNSTYVETDYHQQVDTVSNSTRSIFLYLLNEEFATTFILLVQDQNLNPIPDALINIQRYYPAENVFRTVQVAKADDNGESVGFYETEIVDYKHLIVLNNTILLTTNQGKIVGKEVPFTLIFTVGEDQTVPYAVFEGNPNIFTNLTYDSTSGLVTFTFIDISGQATAGTLTVEAPQFGRSTTTTICDESLAFPSGTINCNVTGYNGTLIARGYVTDGTTSLTDLLNFVIDNVIGTLGNTGLFLSFMIIMTSCLAFLWNPTAGIISLNSSIVFVNLIKLATFNPILIFSIMGVSFIAIVLINR